MGNELSEELLLEIYRKMLRVRRFEEEAYRLFSQGEVAGSIHTSIGQEACSVGICTSLRPDDYVVSTHRGHGHAIAKGARVDRMMAELLGRTTGYCKGKGGSMHITDLSVGMLGANGVVGAGLPIATGAALAIWRRQGDQVCVAFFGDGASNQGTFHESLNLSAVWKLPVVFVCENNGYAVSVPAIRSTSVRDIAVRAQGYGVPGLVVDGMNVLEVHEAGREAIARARRGEGPTLIECKTYRYLGHSRGDPPYGLYRSKEEVDEWRRRDPIPAFAGRLDVEPARLETIQAAVEAEIAAAVKFARESPLPSLEEVLDDIFA